MQSILHITKNGKNQAFGSGSAFFSVTRLFFQGRKFSILALFLSLFLVGSCNEKASLFDVLLSPADFQKLSKVELVRYGYALQFALIDNAENIKKMNADEIKLALSNPDFSRHDGRNALWQYRTESCVLDIYWEGGEPSTPATHFELRQRRSVLDGTQAIIDPVAWQCVQTIVQHNRQKIEGEFGKAYADLSLKEHNS